MPDAVDMERLKDYSPSFGSYALIAGVLYVAIGLWSIMTSLGLVAPFLGSADPVTSVLLLVVGSVFLTGVRPLRSESEDGYAFVIVGLILAAVLFILQIIILSTNALGWLLRLEDWLTWNIINDITPSIWSFPLLFMLMLFLGVSIHFQDNGKGVEHK